MLLDENSDTCKQLEPSEEGENCCKIEKEKGRGRVKPFSASLDTSDS